MGYHQSTWESQEKSASIMMNVQMYSPLLLFACSLAQPQPVSVEQVPYTVIRQMAGGVEEREYPPVSWVCTNGTDEHQRSMFGLLFNYIQGSNADSVKIPMTSPVPVSLSSTGIREMCFYLTGTNPHPEPTDSKVYIIQQDGARNIFTRKLGGSMNEAKWMKEKEDLANILKEEGVDISQERFFMVQYDEPSQLFNRRNEVCS